MAASLASFYRQDKKRKRKWQLRALKSANSLPVDE
jgi:hypothetical protein